MEDYQKFIPPYSEKVTDSYLVKILLCFFLNKIKKHVTVNQLMEIATSNDTVNYFTYNEAINDLIEAKSLNIIEKDGEKYYQLTPLGYHGAEHFKSILPKSLRDKILSDGMKLFADLKKAHDVKCEINAVEGGFQVHCVCYDMGHILMDLTLFAPDFDQASFMKEKLLLNPTQFYGNVIDFALATQESKIEIDEE